MGIPSLATEKVLSTESNRKIVYVNFSDVINDAKVKAVMATFSELINQQKADLVYCLFASSGGFVDPGITLHNFLRSLPIEIVMHNMGSIDSIAGVVFLAGSKRYASQHSSFLFHGVTMTYSQGVVATRNKLVEDLSALDASEAKISGIITERTTLTNEEVRSLFRQGESKDPAFALSKGIVHEVKNPVIPKGVPIYSFNLT